VKLVVIESPFAGATPELAERNLSYAREAMRDSILRGEAPFASHLLYTQVLDDKIPEERALGIQAGFEWGEMAELVAVYTDLGVSRGMTAGIERAQKIGCSVEHRTLQGWVRP